MKIRTLVVTAALALSALATALPASAAGQLCYDVNVTVAGDALVDESGCQQIG